MENSRISNSKRNIIIGILYQVTILILSFISRTIFIKILGIEYLGVNGLFTNILSVLSLAELGIGNAMIYSMYKPLAEENTTKLTALINYYKKLYNTIALVVLIIGILVIPFLGYIVDSNIAIQELRIYYTIFLLDSVTSYLFVYKTSILNADQKMYKIKTYTMVINMVRFFVQLIILILFRNYILYLIVQVVFSVFSNWYCAYKTQLLYPYIKDRQVLEIEDKNAIKSNVKSFFAYQLGNVILNNTDNILISIIIGTVWIGYYSNYIMIISSVSAFTSLIFTSLLASIGNMNVDAEPEKKHFIFKVLNLISFWVYGFCTICFCILLQDFITIWLGKEFLLDNNTVYVAVMTFYLQGVLYPVWAYRHTTGLFKSTKYIMLLASIINILLSVWSGYKFGLAGILGATVVARLFTNVWYEPYKLFGMYFNKSSSKYFIEEIAKFFLVIALIGVINGGINLLPESNTFNIFILKMLACIIIPNTIFFAIYKRTEEFKYLYKNVINKFRI